jgi:hypothetical protein
METGGAYSAERAAALSGVPKSTIYYWARNGHLIPSVSKSPLLWSYTDLLALRTIYWLRRPKKAFDREGRVDGGRGGCRPRESLLPAAFALTPVPQSRSWLRFPPPLIELDVQISRIQLSDGLHERACTGLRRRRVLWISTTPASPNTSA